ncbi:AI-2E family transporter [Phytomonospora endophytica]|uniref:Putative PurR-regulated permease PerM n=1 Tax=Phytomonospora endophytica TaxID=714109 RepID=A0A841F7R6_9ACTN|nr:AI-2E family transporter [Phytomonospora endophytica]MBB6032256.1 putative PurR-regulated permease PerM [Phytomonospora endophytica]
MSTEAGASPPDPGTPRAGATDADAATAPEAEETRAEETPESPYGTPGRRFARTPFHFGLFAGIGLIVAYMLYIGLQQAWGVLLAIIIAGFLAIGINPMVVRVERLVKRRGIAVAIVALVMFIVLCGGFATLLPPLITEVNSFVDALPNYIENLKGNRFINDLNEQYSIIENLKSAASAENITSAAGGLVSVLGVVGGTVFNGLMVVILTFYFLASFNRLKEGAYRLLPAERRPRARALGDEMLTKVGNYTIGALGIAAIAGVTSFIFMFIVDIKYAYALALIVAIFDLIPQVGATIGAVIVSLVGFSVSIPVGIACIIFFVLYQQLENWIIYPRMMSRSVKVSDLGAILGLLIGTALFGIVGALMAVPAVAAIQLLVREVHIPRQDLA